VDVYLPPGASGTVSAILIFTPYYRRFATIMDRSIANIFG
jgi:hypothetical protein